METNSAPKTDLSTVECSLENPCTSVVFTCIKKPLLNLQDKPSQDTYPKDFMHLARWLLKAAPAHVRPYKALTITAVLKASLPNKGPKVVHTFSETDARIYTFKMLPDFTSRSLRVAIIRVISKL